MYIYTHTCTHTFCILARRRCCKILAASSSHAGASSGLHHIISY